MAKKILGIGAVVLLVGALIGGGLYLLLRDSGNGSGGNRYRQDRVAAMEGDRWSGGGQESAGAGNGRGNGGAGAPFVEHGNRYRGGNAGAGPVGNPSRGQAPTPRSESGRPLWSGRGRQGQ